jgi:hypothetical protein
MAPLRRFYCAAGKYCIYKHGGPDWRSTQPLRNEPGGPLRQPYCSGGRLPPGGPDRSSPGPPRVRLTRLNTHHLQGGLANLQAARGYVRRAKRRRCRMEEWHRRASLSAEESGGDETAEEHMFMGRVHMEREKCSAGLAHALAYENELLEGRLNAALGSIADSAVAGAVDAAAGAFLDALLEEWQPLYCRRGAELIGYKRLADEGPPGHWYEFGCPRYEVVFTGGVAGDPVTV